MRKYTLVGRAAREEPTADADTVVRVTEVEISYIDWSIQQDGKF